MTPPVSQQMSRYNNKTTREDTEGSPKSRKKPNTGRYHDNNISTIISLYQQFMDVSDGTLFLYALSFLDVATLLNKKIVNTGWKNLCTKAIDNKCGEDGPHPIETNAKLIVTIRKYCKYEATLMEEIACIYGYPIDKWDVSQ
jgi:hypothetical protein